MEFVIISYFGIENESFSGKSAPVCCRVPWRASQIPFFSDVDIKNIVRCWWQKVNVSVNRESTFRFDEVAGEQSQPLFPHWVKWVASRTDLSVNKNNSLPVSGDATNYRHLTRRLPLIATEVSFQHLRLWDLKNVLNQPSLANCV